VSLESPHRQTLVEAQLTRTVVQFTYRAMGGNAKQRTVDPHAMIHRSGRWYLVGRDHARDQRRAYRLDRIEGEVRTVGEPHAFAPPDTEISVDDVLPAPPPGGPETAEVLASDDVAWQVARRARGGGKPEDEGWTRFVVPVRDAEELLGWVLPLGPDVTVMEPPELRDLVIERLRALL
jgi:proteasome accessory factor B